MASMNSYPLIDFPIDKPCDEMTKAEAMAHFNWFLDGIERRIELLTKEVQFQKSDWSPDFKRESLMGLGEWVKSNAKMKKITQSERDRIISENNFTGLQKQLVLEQQFSITHETYRIIFDAGIYLAECLRKQINFLEWKMEKDKRLVDYQNPVLVKVNEVPKGSMPLNPIRASYIIVAGMLKSDWKPDNFLRKYDSSVRNFTLGFTI